MYQNMWLLTECLRIIAIGIQQQILKDKDKIKIIQDLREKVILLINARQRECFVNINDHKDSMHGMFSERSKLRTM